MSMSGRGVLDEIPICLMFPGDKIDFCRQAADGLNGLTLEILPFETEDDAVTAAGIFDQYDQIRDPTRQSADALRTMRIYEFKDLIGSSLVPIVICIEGDKRHILDTFWERYYEFRANVEEPSDPDPVAAEKLRKVLRRLKECSIVIGID
jgi:hypothetical protein